MKEGPLIRSKVVIFIDWFYPAYKAGGPIKSVYNIVSSLSDKCDFLIVTSNQDIDGEINKKPSNEILVEEHYHIIYLEKTQQNKRKYSELIRGFEPSIVYLNGIFSMKYTLLPLLMLKEFPTINVILAPRGMLTKGALAIKPLKKKVFLTLVKKFLFKQRAIRWHASSADEKQQVNRVFGRAEEVHVAQNLTSSLQLRKTIIEKSSNSPLKLICIARICPIKNQLWLLQLLKEVPYLNLELSFFGPIEDQAYWKECEKLMLLDDRVTYNGVLNPQTVTEELQKHHFFVLPTENENYGHSIVEAINSGVPVLISDRTPWLKLNDSGIGFDIALDDRALWLEKLERLSVINQLEYDNMVKACYGFAERHVHSEKVLVENRELFNFY